MRTKKLLYLLVGFVLLFISSCKKSDPQQNAPGNSPLFYFNGTANGIPVNIQAGVNNYYMFSSYALDGNGIYDFTGELKNYNCTANCANALKISIKDYRQYSIGQTNIDSSITPGYFSFATPLGTPSTFDMQFFDSLYAQNAQSYLWNFGDGTTSSLANPLHRYKHPGIYTVSLNAQSTSGCYSSLTNDVVVGQTGNPILIAFAGNAAGNMVNFVSSVGGGLPPYSYLWNFGDGNTSTAVAPSHMYSASGVYPVTLTITDGANTTQTSHTNASTSSVTVCNVNFYPTITTPLANPKNLSDVTLEWRDASGTLYTSSNNSQPGKSMFKVISIDNYQNNTGGQPTKIIHAKVSCTLYNGTSSIQLTGETAFSVAHL
jgi:PKD repeat protein